MFSFENWRMAAEFVKAEIGKTFIPGCVDSCPSSNDTGHRTSPPLVHGKVSSATSMIPNGSIISVETVRYRAVPLGFYWRIPYLDSSAFICGQRSIWPFDAPRQAGPFSQNGLRHTQREKCCPCLIAEPQPWQRVIVSSYCAMISRLWASGRCELEIAISPFPRT